MDAPREDGDEDDDDDDDDDDGDDIAVILRELPPPDVEEGWLGAESKKEKSKTNKKYQKGGWLGMIKIMLVVMMIMQ